MSVRRTYRHGVKPQIGGNRLRQNAFYQRQNDDQLAELAAAVAEAFKIRPAPDAVEVRNG